MTMSTKDKLEFPINTINSFTKVTQVVRYLLETKPYLRGNDNLLWCYFLRYYHKLDWRVIKNHEGVGDMVLMVPVFGHDGRPGIKNLTSLETVTRCRRKIQEKEPTLKPKEKTTSKRRLRESVVRDLMKGD